MDLPTLATVFDHAVRSGSWEHYGSGFADAAVVEFVGPPVGSSVA